MVDLVPFLRYEFPTTTLYALWFLLGSQAVAGLSDLRRMAAQREFMEVWIIFAVVVFGLDGWRVYQGNDVAVFLVKWALILAAALLSWQRVGGIFHLARGDVWAIVAVTSLFNPLFVVLYMLILKVVDLVLRPALRRFGSGSAYPFLPVVIVATLLTVALILMKLVDRVLDAFGVS